MTNDDDGLIGHNKEHNASQRKLGHHKILGLAQTGVGQADYGGSGREGVGISDMVITCSNPPIGDHARHLVALCWPQPTS